MFRGRFAGLRKYRVGNWGGVYFSIEKFSADVRVETLPSAYRAYQSYPNPFNPLCTIRYDIPRPGRVRLCVFDAEGSLVRSLFDGWKGPGAYSAIWDGTGDEGSDMPSGVHFYRLEAGDFLAMRKIVLLK